MPKPQLTDRQREVYDLIQSLIQKRGYGPTVREIGEHFGIKSPNGVMCHLRALERKGLITRKANKSRAIELTGEHSRSATSLPLIGIVSSEPVQLDLQSTEAIDIGKTLATGKRFAVQVSGDALVDSGIYDGDHVVIAKQTQASDGQLVLATVSDGQALLRYWHPRSKHVELRAANEDLKSINASDPTVIGVAVCVVRTVL